MTGTTTLSDGSIQITIRYRQLQRKTISKFVGKMDKVARKRHLFAHLRSMDSMKRTVPYFLSRLALISQ